jgi:hypothetical protein
MSALFAAGLETEWKVAARARDKQRMVELLRKMDGAKV